MAPRRADPRDAEPTVARVRGTAAGRRTGGRTMAEKKGKGSDTAKKANAKAGAEGKSNPRTSSAAQAELGKKGGKSKK
jgi:hypothetical protein